MLSKSRILTVLPKHSILPGSHQRHTMGRLLMQQYPILSTKLFVPPVRTALVSRSRLIDQLNAGLGEGNTFARKLTLISALAGFGKTTLVAEWIQVLRDQDKLVDIA